MYGREGALLTEHQEMVRVEDEAISTCDMTRMKNKHGADGILWNTDYETSQFKP